MDTASEYGWLCDAQASLRPDRIMGRENPHEPPSVDSLACQHHASLLDLTVSAKDHSALVSTDLIVEVCLVCESEFPLKDALTRVSSR